MILRGVELTRLYEEPGERDRDLIGANAVRIAEQEVPHLRDGFRTASGAFERERTAVADGGPAVEDAGTPEPTGDAGSPATPDAGTRCTRSPECAGGSTSRVPTLKMKRRALR